MSYDLGIGDIDFNITYNVGKMFYHHNEKGIRSIYGLTGKESLPLLIDMLNHFILNKDKLMEFEPSNGWGSYDNTVKCLLKMCISAYDNKEEKWSGD